MALYGTEPPFLDPGIPIDVYGKEPANQPTSNGKDNFLWMIKD